jgi:hypothetical protein
MGWLENPTLRAFMWGVICVAIVDIIAMLYILAH